MNKLNVRALNMTSLEHLKEIAHLSQCISYCSDIKIKPTVDIVQTLKEINRVYPEMIVGGSLAVMIFAPPRITVNINVYMRTYVNEFVYNGWPVYVSHDPLFGIPKTVDGLRFASPEHMCIIKFNNGTPKDLYDVENLLYCCIRLDRNFIRENVEKPEEWDKLVALYSSPDEENH